MSCNLKTKEQIAKEKLACNRNRTIPQKWNDKTCKCELIKRKKPIPTGDKGFYKRVKPTDKGFYKRVETTDKGFIKQ